MNTKGFLLLLVTVIVIGGSIGGAFAGGLALGRSQSDDADPVATLLQQRFGGGQAGATQGGQFGSAQSGSGVQPAQEAPTSLGEGGITRRGPGQAGAGGTSTSEVFSGTVSSLNGTLLTVAAGDGAFKI